MYANVVVEYPVKTLDKEFTYYVPEELKSQVKVGMKVAVEFGKKDIQGFILGITDIYDGEYELKPIKSILEPDLVLSNELIELGKYIRNETLCTLISAYQSMLPSALKINKNNRNYNFYKTYIELDKTEKEIKEYVSKCRYPRQVEILNLLLQNKRMEKRVLSCSGLDTLIKKELVKEIKEQEYRINVIDKNINKVKLTEEQDNAYKTIKTSFNKNETFLLYGITGSGKTEIYLNSIEDVVNSGKQAIMLAPEISLTMQIVKRFYERFGSKVAVLHSALSDGERHDEYLKISRGEVSVVVGTRSAIFAPFNNLGIIIIDEEHSDTYKQDNMPRYNAKDVAKFRCKYYNIPLVLASATPLLDSMARAQKGVYTLVTLKQRVGNSVLPQIHLVDMEAEYKKKNFIFSDLLKEKINERLEKKEQVILFLNRRGFSTFVSCSNCGYTYKCPNCDISLTYHKSTNNLVCHYCGYNIKCDELCPNCKEKSLNYLGLGTEKLEQEIKNSFPLANVVRMDQDTTSKKGSHDKIIEDFKNEKYNLLLGTSMISKGLDFPKVTLVGVVNADTTLNIPDYRSNENTFDLLEQVSGRAGRANLLGEVVIQTFNVDNNVLKYVKESSYDNFYNTEMLFRRKLKYPPYYYLVSIRVLDKEYERALSEAKKCVSYLKENVCNETIVLGPTTAAILKFNNVYRFQIIVKYRFDEKLKETLHNLDQMYSLNDKTSIEIDFNPTRI